LFGFKRFELDAVENMCKAMIARLGSEEQGKYLSEWNGRRFLDFKGSKET
jgi:hypothetical protein